MYKKLIGLLILCLVMCIGCSETRTYVKPETTVWERKKPAEVEILDSDCVIIHGRSKDSDKLDLFVSFVKNDISVSLRIIQYTIEGDPIIQQISLDNGVIVLKSDFRYDQFGDGGVITEKYADIFMRVIELEDNSYKQYVGIKDSEEFVLFQILVEE